MPIPVEDRYFVPTDFVPKRIYRRAVEVREFLAMGRKGTTANAGGLDEFHGNLVLAKSRTGGIPDPQVMQRPAYGGKYVCKDWSGWVRATGPSGTSVTPIACGRYSCRQCGPIRQMKLERLWTKEFMRAFGNQQTYLVTLTFRNRRSRFTNGKHTESETWSDYARRVDTTTEQLDEDLARVSRPLLRSQRSRAQMLQRMGVLDVRSLPFVRLQMPIRHWYALQTAIWSKLTKNFEKAFGHRMDYLCTTEDTQAGMPHLHFVTVDCCVKAAGGKDRYSQWLSREWKSLTRDSNQIKVTTHGVHKRTDVTGRQGKIKYVLKYILKDAMRWRSPDAKGLRRYRNSQSVTLPMSGRPEAFEYADPETGEVLSLDRFEYRRWYGRYRNWFRANTKSEGFNMRAARDEQLFGEGFEHDPPYWEHWEEWDEVRAKYRHRLLFASFEAKDVKNHWEKLGDHVRYMIQYRDGSKEAL